MKPVLAPLALILAATAAQAQTMTERLDPDQAVLAAADCLHDWTMKPFDQLASDCVDIAFSDNLYLRELFAWVVFARVTELIPDSDGPGMNDTGQAPLWMSWATDPETFDPAPQDGKNTLAAFNFDAREPRNQMRPSTEEKDFARMTLSEEEPTHISTEDPDGANEEVNRNQIAYDYLIANGLTTKAGVATFFETHDTVEMPVGSIELKASWLQVTDGSPAPEGALTFPFQGGTYWWRGLHIMMKMRPLDHSSPYDIFYSEDPSWFWSTFEFNNNPGTQHVRDALITQRAPLDPALIERLLTDMKSEGFGFENLAPNGTQIRFTVDGRGEPVILGHTNMEDFAGKWNTAQPYNWVAFEASCHGCHATASYRPNPEFKRNPAIKNPCKDDWEKAPVFFPFSVPVGKLHPGYNMQDACSEVAYLGQGFMPLDFMWPIAFQTK
ncbi:hypothetical protein [Sagittula salina]|uniref:Cytochrome c domain-containing protein n=1 Tax=Sagittula salina TaxID=2820268 RepID=A0A940S1H4_9RHOB|nr:hypothetical protein [Sagittula salina]MBP0483126.1 hypothetical protein [Sagittula salina]